MQKRMHSREFKLEVVRQIASRQKRPAQACREYGLAEHTNNALRCVEFENVAKADFT